MPLLVPPLEYDDLKAVLAGVQAGHINDKRPLNELRDRLLEAGIASGATDKWETKRDTFIKSFERIANELNGRSSIPAAEHEKLKATYEEAQNTIVEKEETIHELEVTVQELRNCKDAAEVQEVMANRTTAEAQFKELKSTVRRELRDLPAKAVDAIYYDTREEDWHPPQGPGTNYDWDDIEDARQRGFIEMVDGGVSVDESNPKMRRAKQAIAALSAFMNDAPMEFIEHFEESYDYQFDIGNRDFWDHHVIR